MRKARAWGVRALAAKRRKFFDEAKLEGLVPSVQDLNAKASKDEVKQELDKKASKEETKAELEQLKVDTEAKLDALKGIISVLFQGHPMAKEIRTRLQNV
ncbi:hypothetical protein BGX38DRAFT_1156197 [Terfezia claveryi]|nr:hypothetical protein BGX38DRAFT_1156197 [Terfezia claveryi]